MVCTFASVGIAFLAFLYIDIVATDSSVSTLVQTDPNTGPLLALLALSFWPQHSVGYKPAHSNHGTEEPARSLAA